MSNWTQLKSVIASVIKTNGNNEITGQLLQDTLFAMVTDLGENATFKGLATTSTAPGTQDGPVFYVATSAGTYTAFGLTIGYNGVYVISNLSGSWQLIPLLVLNKLVANIFALNTSVSTATLLKGELAWNEEEGTADLGMNGGSVRQSLGLELYYHVQFTENIADGDHLMNVGTDGNSGKIKAAKFVPGTDPKLSLGLATEAGVSGTNGFSTWFGKLRGFNTTGAAVSESWAPSDFLYPHPTAAGKLTKTKPAFGTKTAIAQVISAHTNGSLFSRSVASFSLTDLDDVNITSATAGQPLVKSAQGWVNSSDVTLDKITPKGSALVIDGGVVVETVAAGEVQSTGGFKRTGNTDADLLLAGGGALAVSALKAGVYQLFNPSNNTQVVLEINAAGQVIIKGDIIQQGVAYDTHAENINTPQAVIKLRDGATVGLNVNELAGFVIEKYDGVNNGIIAIDKDGVLRIGDEGSLQPVATREETPVDQSLSYWDAATLRFKTIAAALFKTSLVDADAVPVRDSAASNAMKWWTFANIKANLKAYFDTIYLRLADVAQTLLGKITFAKPPTVPAPVDGTDAVNKDYVTAAVINTMPAATQELLPMLAYKTRIDSDLGNIQDLNKLTELYIKNLSLLDSTVFLWNGEAGAKQRTSGSNTFASKLYNMANKVQQFGSELVTNGTFATDSGWTKGTGWSISDGKLKGNATTDNAWQAASSLPNGVYHITYTISDYVAGTVDVNLGGNVNTSAKNANGTYTESVTITSPANSNIYVRGRTAFTGSVDNLSIKKMDWIEGANDAVQTTEANQPYLGGLIAPNEVGKLKDVGNITSDNKKLGFSNVLKFAENGMWSFTLMLSFSEIYAFTDYYILGNFYIGFNTASKAIRVDLSQDGGNSILSNAVFTNDIITKNNIITISYNNGAVQFWLNGILVGSGTISSKHAAQFAVTPSKYTGSVRNGISAIYNYQIHNRALSASEIQAQHDFLRLQIPEIEGIAIGNQYWATSNYEGVVAGDGSVIPEVQYDKSDGTGTNNSPELMINGSYESGLFGSLENNAGGAIAVYTLNASSPISGLQDGRLQVTTAGTTAARPYITRAFTAIPGKVYLLSFKYKVNSGVCVFGGFFNGSSFVGGGATLTGLGTLSAYVVCVANNIFGVFGFDGRNVYDVQVDDISAKEVAWADSTAVYNAIIAQGGTELAALKAAAMWCYYDNNVNNGAIYGKLYNWYAVKLISLYPPQGYRVPTSADFTQLSNYLGGTSVAGGKMKKEGLAYWASPNTGATNESGLSLIPNGFRSIVGVFTSQTTRSAAWGVDIAPVLVAPAIVTYASDATISLALNDNKLQGFSLRLLRNSSVGPNEKTTTSTTIVSDIASTANSTQIPFGYSVASIRLKTTANLTNIKVELWNNFYSGTPTLVSTLITGKTANNTTMVFPVLADSAALLQDGTLRITATGAATFETIVEYNLQKNTF